MKSYPKAVAEHKELVLRCLADDDVTIRTKALELLTGMVTRRNLTELVHKLMQHVLLAEGAYRDEIIAKVIFMCSRDKYAYLSGAYERPAAALPPSLPPCMRESSSSTHRLLG